MNELLHIYLILKITEDVIGAFLLIVLITLYFIYEVKK